MGDVPGVFSVRRRGLSWAGAGLLALLGVLSGAGVRAAVTEPPIPPSVVGESVPKPSSAAELSVVTAYGFTEMDGTLAGLFASRGEVLDYVKDAQTDPGAFSPQCAFTVQLVLRAGGCPVGVGWYNAVPGSATPPSQDQIHTLIPGGFPACAATIDPASACCDDTVFCPLATYDTQQVGLHRWNLPALPADLIRNDPRYTGGLIGFVLMGVGSPDGRCNQNKYSQLGLNQLSPNGQPWLGAVVYQSTADPSSYYLAFEDQPTAATTWKGPNNSSDGDFNDVVLYLKGAVCQGASGTGGGGVGGSDGSGGTTAAGGAGGGGGDAGSDSSGRGFGGGGASTSNGGSNGAEGGRPAVAAGGGGGGAGGAGAAVAAGGGGGSAAGGTTAPLGGSAGAVTDGNAGGKGGGTVTSAKSGCNCAVASRGPTDLGLAAGLTLALLVRRRCRTSRSRVR